MADVNVKLPENGLTKRLVETSPGVHAEETSVIVAGASETVAASQTDQVMGATGAAGDYLGTILVTPETTSPGEVSIKDGAGTKYVLFVGGGGSVSNLVPFTIFVGEFSQAGAWKVTTGANVHVRCAGRFT